MVYPVCRVFKGGEAYCTDCHYVRRQPQELVAQADTLLGIVVKAEQLIKRESGGERMKEPWYLVVQTKAGRFAVVMTVAGSGPHLDKCGYISSLQWCPRLGQLRYSDIVSLPGSLDATG